ncbi:hypothetical protein L6X53_RS10680 [Escherichia coli]|nr:hypothetical protein [Escherichia coli]EIW8260293.1 hypothetical protein [Escherichia coli]EKG6984739.1 hypothetical protein [Escherichia coli]ELM1816762.1 hypothetical protein [Escherichia coli]EMC8174010.1 hypothetical protein [Escherichia coli]
MHMGQALDLVSRYDSLRNPLTSLGDYLDPELISRCLAESGTVTAGNFFAYCDRKVSQNPISQTTAWKFAFACPAADSLGDCSWLIARVKRELAQATASFNQPCPNLLFVHMHRVPVGL